MPLDKIDPPNVFTPAVWAGMFGMLAGAAHWFQQIVDGEKEFRWWHLPMVLVIGEFFGLFGFFTAQLLGFSPEVGSIAGGALAAGGTVGFKMATRVLRRVLRL